MTTIPKTEYIMAGFAAYQKHLRSEVEAGRITKSDAVSLILDRVVELLDDLRMPEGEYLKQTFGDVALDF